PTDLDRRIGRAVFLGDLLRRAVEHDRALIAAEVDLNPAAGNPRLPLLHPLDEFLLGHELPSPLSAGLAARPAPFKPRSPVEIARRVVEGSTAALIKVIERY